MEGGKIYDAESNHHKASKPRKRFIGTKSVGSSKKANSSTVTNQIPQEILSNAQLNAAISQIPSNYSFEIHKTIWNIKKYNSNMVALQMPEGLQMYACTIADIIERFTTALAVIMGDVTYGACCIDDYTAIALGCDLLVHYGHSCLVPIDQTTIKTLYIFVEIAIDPLHLEQTVRLNFPGSRYQFQSNLLVHGEYRSHAPLGNGVEKGNHLQIEAPSMEDTCSGVPETSSPMVPTRLALVSTIQFVAALSQLKEDLNTVRHGSHVFNAAGLVGQGAISSTSKELESPSPTSHLKFWTGRYDSVIPQSKPLSPGEILGCTAPQLTDVDALLYLGDGRFHLESIMIANPSVPAFRYDPYSKKLTREWYNHSEMRSTRHRAITTARESLAALSHLSQRGKDPPPLWGIVLGTLGRQGSFKQLQAIKRQLSSPRVAIPNMPILLSELSPAKLSLFNPYVSTFIQTSCPRLSIDWGYAFDRPLLSPYETTVVMAGTAGWMGGTGEGEDAAYPMDFYAAGTPWAIARAKALYP